LYWLTPFLNSTAATMQVTTQYVQVTAPKATIIDTLRT
jgi:hypothetical protein